MATLAPSGYQQPPVSKAQPFFTPKLFEFLIELRYNNNRRWFEANKSRYQETVKEPFVRFIEALAPRLEAINPAYSASPKSLFRIHRDTRFSPDKTPYKTHAAAQFRHIQASRDVHAPGFYMHLEPGACFLGGGIWMPDPETLRPIRAAIARQDYRWLELRKTLPISEEDKLKRPPKDHDSHHPLVEDLKLKSFIATFSLSEEEVCSVKLLDKVSKAFEKTNRLNVFLCQVLGFEGQQEAGGYKLKSKDRWKREGRGKVKSLS
jgi:uncharacterized protein (TIGR02453 family)